MIEMGIPFITSIQRRLYKLQNDFLTQLQEDLKNIEASTQNKCANYLGGKLTFFTV